ncbi:unnamed protein product [Arabidopsis halleri]
MMTSMLLSRLRLGTARRFSRLLLSNGFSSSMLQTPPCSILAAKPCGEGLGKLVTMSLMMKNGSDTDSCFNFSDKKVPLELIRGSDGMVTIGASHGWVATLTKDDGILRLQDDLNPVASDVNPKRIPLPPLGMFRIPGSGGHLIGSWDLNHHTSKFQELHFQNLPELTKTQRELLDLCFTSQHLVESPAGETFLVTWYRKTDAETINGISKLKTEALMVFKLNEYGSAVYTQDIGDLCIFLSKSEPFAVSATSFPGILSNHVVIYDFDELIFVQLDEADSPIVLGDIATFGAPYHIPPQNI